jgi:tetratricopeptide (TPR) repeat protein
MLIAALLFLALGAGPTAWAQEDDDDDDLLSWIQGEAPDLPIQEPPPPGGGLRSLGPEPRREPDPPAQGLADPGLRSLFQDADLPALVLDPDPSPENIDPSAAGEGEVNPSAPGMTGSTGGTIPIMLVEAAYLAHRKGDFKTAIDGYTSIIRRRGLTRRERSVSYLLRGEARRGAGQLDEAILDFTRALRQWPGYPSAHYFRGRIYEKQNKLNEAYADLAMAVQLDPARESYQTSLSLLKLRLREAGLLSDGPPPRPVEPRLPEE